MSAHLPIVLPRGVLLEQVPRLRHIGKQPTEKKKTVKKRRKLNFSVN
jgi:hypothetical protein